MFSLKFIIFYYIINMATGAVTIISELGGSSGTDANNVSQNIVVPAAYAGYDVSSITLFMNNLSTGSFDIVLDLYSAIADTPQAATSTNVDTRFAGVTKFHTTDPTTIAAGGGTLERAWPITVNTPSTFFIVAREAENGPTTDLSIKGDFSVPFEGCAGGNAGKLKYTVVANPPLVSAILSNDNLNFKNSSGTSLCKLTASSTELKIESTQLNVNNKKITNLATPTADRDAATKAYVDSMSEGLDVKHSCVVATTTTDGNIDITSVLGQNDTIDNTSVNDGARVLLKHQTSSSENGIYVYNSGNISPWTRADDMPASSNAAGSFTFIELGTVNGDKGFVCTTDSPSDTVDTHSLAFTQFSGAGQIIVSNGLTKSGDNISITSKGVTTEHLADLNVTTGKLDNNAVTADKLASNIPMSTFSVTATAAELSILDGNTAATATTLGGADRLVVNDDDVGMKQVALTDLKTYTEGALVTLSNVTTVAALNAGSITSGFGSIDVGASAISTTGAVTGGSFSTHSDIRLKTNISEIENGIEKVNKIRGVNFTWKEDNREDFGVIAQEVEEVAPHAVHEGSDGYKKVDYSKLTALLIQAVKEQQTTIESQQSQIDDLKELVNKLVNSPQ